jgi:hypothetical protein
MKPKTSCYQGCNTTVSPSLKLRAARDVQTILFRSLLSLFAWDGYPFCRSSITNGNCRTANITCHRQLASSFLHSKMESLYTRVTMPKRLYRQKDADLKLCAVRVGCTVDTHSLKLCAVKDGMHPMHQASNSVDLA